MITPAAAAQRVLVVDDEIDIREVIEMVLRMAHYDVTTVDCGQAAVAAARDGRFDLLVTDYRMPGMSGAATIGALKALHPDMRVLVATGYFSEEIFAECRARGADDFLRKPVELEELLRVVRALLA